MKWLIVGSDKIYAIENFYVKHLREAGNAVELFTAQSIFYDYYYRNIFNKIIFKAGLSSIYKKINKLFIKKITEQKPDLIWIFKGMEITPESLEWVKSKNIPLVMYNPDNPFIFTGKGSGNKNVTEALPLYDLHFTYNLEIKAKLDNDFNAKTSFLPFGFDVSNELRAEVAKQDEVIKACFLGNPDSQRGEFILQLAQRGVAMDLYGNDWDKFVQHKLITFFPAVYDKELWKTLYRYRVQVNIMRIHNENSHNMRTFETPGIGAIQLAPDTVEHRIFFVADQEIFLYTDADSCVEKIKFLLSLSSAEAMEYRKKAMHRADTSGYSYRSRAAFVADEVKQTFNLKG